MKANEGRLTQKRANWGRWGMKADEG